MLKDSKKNTLRHTRRFRETHQAEFGRAGIDLRKTYRSEGEAIADLVDVCLDDAAAQALLKELQSPSPDNED